jgi:hypothetical protein
VVTACAAAIYAVLIPLWVLRRRADRRFSPIPLDPYQVIAILSSRTDGEIYRAAAAALLTEGWITIAPDGTVAVTERGGIPTHPIEAALLEYFRHAAAPVALSRIPETGALRLQRDAFLRQQNRRLPRWFRRSTDSLRWISETTQFLLTAFYAVQIVYFGPFRPSTATGYLISLVPLALIWVLIAVPVASIINGRLPERRNPLLDHCATLPPHPAVQALDPDSQRLLDASVRYRTPAQVQILPYYETGSDTY